MTVTPYVDMYNMDFIQFHSRNDNTEKKLSESSNFACINICDAIIVVGSVFNFNSVWKNLRKK
jgi:lipoprotein signal peptidase